ncbi:MAG: PLP-dependent aminotransferase family protein [Xanthomonadales bacterium]|nr:PLP-dependent aminotransferase family protein [Xanthomonadales bacterium]
MSRVTFDGEPPAGTINLGIGQPSRDLLPTDLLRRASEAFFAEAHPNDLNYGNRQGDQRFLSSLATYLTHGYGTAVDPETLFLTGSNSQAIDLVSGVFTEPGDTILVEEPTYFLALNIFRDHRLKIVCVPVDEQGLDLDALEALVARHRPAFLYTIPSYHNPGGHCLSAERRRRLVELSLEQEFLIVADEVYQLLYYGEPPPPPLGSWIDGGSVLSLGSFSKILAPGLRLGWIQTSPTLREKLMARGFVSSGGSINHVTSHIVRQAMDTGLLEKHVQELRAAYGARVEVMDQALHQHFAGIARWLRPSGGYFFWLELDEAVDTAPVLPAARQGRTGFQPGSLFSADGNLAHCLRLSFAHYGEADIVEGITRLRPLFD